MYATPQELQAAVDRQKFISNPRTPVKAAVDRIIKECKLTKQQALCRILTARGILSRYDLKTPQEITDHLRTVFTEDDIKRFMLAMQSEMIDRIILKDYE